MTKPLSEYYKEVVAEDNSPAQCENQAMAIRRYVEGEMGLTDPDLLKGLFDQTYSLLNDGTAFDEEDEADADEGDDE